MEQVSKLKIYATVSSEKLRTSSDKVKNFTCQTTAVIIAAAHIHKLLFVLESVLDILSQI